MPLMKALLGPYDAAVKRKQSTPKKPVPQIQRPLPGQSAKMFGSGGSPSIPQADFSPSPTPIGVQRPVQGEAGNATPGLSGGQVPFQRPLPGQSTPMYGPGGYQGVQPNVVNPPTATGPTSIGIPSDVRTSLGIPQDWLANIKDGAGSRDPESGVLNLTKWREGLQEDRYNIPIPEDIDTGNLIWDERGWRYPDPKEQYIPMQGDDIYKNSIFREANPQPGTTPAVDPSGVSEGAIPAPPPGQEGLDVSQYLNPSAVNQLISGQQAVVPSGADVVPGSTEDLRMRRQKADAAAFRNAEARALFEETDPAAMRRKQISEANLAQTLAPRLGITPAEYIEQRRAHQLAVAQQRGELGVSQAGAATEAYGRVTERQSEVDLASKRLEGEMLLQNRTLAHQMNIDVKGLSNAELTILLNHELGLGKNQLTREQMQIAERIETRRLTQEDTQNIRRLGLDQQIQDDLQKRGLLTIGLQEALQSNEFALKSHAQKIQVALAEMANATTLAIAELENTAEMHGIDVKALTDMNRIELESYLGEIAAQVELDKHVNPLAEQKFQQNVALVEAQAALGLEMDVIKGILAHKMVGGGGYGYAPGMLPQPGRKGVLGSPISDWLGYRANQTQQGYTDQAAIAAAQTNQNPAPQLPQGGVAGTGEPVPNERKVIQSFRQPR